MNIAGEKIIYMEIEKYSSYDELEPYSQATTDLYKRGAPYKTGQNDFGTKVNSAFGAGLRPSECILKSAGF